MMMKSAINWEALMDRIKDVEGIEDDCKFKRLHLFLTEENIERANDILTNAKKGGEGHTDNAFKQSDDSSSDTSECDSAALDAISENSFFDDSREFQGIMIDKVRDIKTIITMVMDRIQSNALVLYNMQHMCQKNFIPFQKMSKALHEMQLYNNSSIESASELGSSCPTMPLNFDIECR